MALDRETLLGYLSNSMRLDLDSVEDDSPLFSTSRLDSFHMVELIQFIETEGGFRMAAMDVTMDNLDTVASILAFSVTKAG